MVKFIGQINRKQVNELYGSARAGIVIYQLFANSIDSHPNKLFEYMAAGLPVVASNLPHWIKIIESNNCGLIVDPKDPEAVRAACLELINNPQKAQELGRNGRNAVIQKFNWDVEEVKLLDLYKNL